MGENQGMIWIILGVLVVAAAVIFLGTAMGDSTGAAADEVALTSAQSIAACQAVELSDGTKGGNPVDAAGNTTAVEADYDRCIAP